MVICVFLFSLHPQTNQSFEAQEVSSPTKMQAQPQWRQKVMNKTSLFKLLIFFLSQFYD